MQSKTQQQDIGITTRHRLREMAFVVYVFGGAVIIVITFALFLTEMIQAMVAVQTPMTQQVFVDTPPTQLHRIQGGIAVPLLVFFLVTLITSGLVKAFFDPKDHTIVR